MATRAEWAERVERWEKSGQSAEAFAARERISAKRLTWWRWSLHSSSATARAAREPVRFLPVRVVEPSVPGTTSVAPVEIVLPNGRIVRVATGFDPATLERVLSIASEAES
jgi:transposase